jgi:hypothetical protein
MRLSANNDDPGFRAWSKVAPRAKIIVRLNGALMMDCITVDTKRGYVLAAEFDDKGVPVMNARGDQYRRKQHYGRVEVEFERRA